MKKLMVVIPLIIICFGLIGVIYVRAHPQLLEYQFRIAIDTGDTSRMKLLIALGADVNMVNPKNGRTPLYEDTSMINVEVMKLLLSHRANIKVRD